MRDYAEEDAWCGRCAALGTTRASRDVAAAKVLRDAADEVEAECSGSSGACICGSAAWLRARANTIGGDE